MLLERKGCNARFVFYSEGKSQKLEKEEWIFIAAYKISIYVPDYIFTNLQF